MKGTNIYYSVEKESEDVNGFQELNGNKTVSIYKIVRNKPVLLGEVSCDLTDYSRNIVVVFLHQNHINFNEITLI